MRLLPLAALRLMPEAITYAPGESLSSPSWGRVRCQARLLSVEEVLWWRLKGREERLALRQAGRTDSEPWETLPARWGVFSSCADRSQDRVNKPWKIYQNNSRDLVLLFC